MGMTRSQIREHIFKLLFTVNFYDDSDKVNEQGSLYFEQLPVEESVEGEMSKSDKDSQAIYATDEERAAIREKVAKITEKIPELDEAIDGVAKGWRTGRMARTDLTILRLALFEMKYDETIPTGVAINEAVELAKKYGTDASAAFINGILAKLV